MMKATAKYRPKKPAAIGFVVLICAGFLLTVGRWYSVIDNGFVLINDAFHSHISNLSLSMIFCVGIGYSWLLYGAKFRFIVILCVFSIFANFICETIMGFMNTPDIIDAVYGTIGVAVAFVFLFVVNMRGLLMNNKEGKNL